eukprot:TRINITY_DN11848_c0_g1_i1.p1 TRINITY_DN11848_c0_g1~~TRINITY_DN11848_c0_g1_i1.p1  ORF type:complete len:255 (+),score=44.81 TRINITY_DN11848_c0_g1_i1:38-802(+)
MDAACGCSNVGGSAAAMEAATAAVEAAVVGVSAVAAADVRGRVDSPSTTVVVCRHGTTFWNLEKRWQGEKDTDLAPEGEAQARAESDAFVAAGRRFNAVYSSDLKRAATTAAILAEPHGCTVQLDRRLRECSLGPFEGLVSSEVKGPKYIHIFERLNDLPHEERMRSAYFEGLETPADMSARIVAAASEAAQRHERGDQILFVTHSTCMEAILAAECLAPSRRSYRNGAGTATISRASRCVAWLGSSGPSTAKV